MLRNLKEQYFQHQKSILKVIEKADTIILDKKNALKLCLCSILSRGHLLIEDIPGMGKTSLVKTLSQLLGLPSNRIQFTNDMLPADILGTNIWNKANNSFKFHKGPIFSNFILADEINRASPKTQSALLQAMEESYVSIDGKHLELPDPFFLIATQNPIDKYGTFPLPDSQLDRFLMRIEIGYPSRAAEKSLLTEGPRKKMISELENVLSNDELNKIFLEVNKIHVSETVINYVQDLVEKSRTLTRGLSPRAAIDLVSAAKSWAYIEQRNYVLPEDVQEVAVSVMNHRISSEQSSSYELAKEIIHSTPVQ
jgi:MoxR-like ATPase